MPRHKILTSREALLKHLDAKADEHNGNTGADLAELLDRRLRPTNKDIADEFGISAARMAEWIKVYDSKEDEK